MCIVSCWLIDLSCVDVPLNTKQTNCWLFSTAQAIIPPWQPSSILPHMLVHVMYLLEQIQSNKATASSNGGFRCSVGVLSWNVSSDSCLKYNSYKSVMDQLLTVSVCLSVWLFVCLSVCLSVGWFLSLLNYHVKLIRV